MESNLVIGDEDKLVLVVMDFSKESPGSVYHDIYDFAILPARLGEVLTWVMKTTLRCRKAKCDHLHIHIVTNRAKVRHNPNANAFIFELLPAFYACPNLGGITFHGSREAFEGHWARAVEMDPLAQVVYREHQKLYRYRDDVKLVSDFLKNRCSVFSDLNDDFSESSYAPRLRVMAAADAAMAHIRAAYPGKTFWVTVHSELSGLHSSVSENVFNPDTTFLQWYRFMERANTNFPHVRFLLVGPLQEKLLPMLKLPNVLAARVLGMNLGYELALIAQSDLFMGSLAGPAEMAIFSAVDYALFSCNPTLCKKFGIPYGATHLPFASPEQMLYYGNEDADLLIHILEKRVRASEIKAGSTPGPTHRFFISAEAEERELYLIVHSQVRDLTLQYELGQFAIVRKEVRQLAETFPTVAMEIPNYRLLKGLVDVDEEMEAPDPKMDARLRRDELVAQLVQALFPQKLDFQKGSFSRTSPVITGLRRDGWCSQTTTFRLGSSSEGALLIFLWKGTTSGKAMEVVIQIAGEHPVRRIVEKEESVMEVPIKQDHLRTDVTLKFDSAYPIHVLDPHICSASLQSVEIGTISTLERFYPRSLVRKNGSFVCNLADCSGLRRDGWCSEETKLSLGSAQAGSQLVFTWCGTALGKPIGLQIKVAHEKPLQVILDPSGAETRFVLTRSHDLTRIFLTFKSGLYFNPDDSQRASAILDSVVIEPA